MWHDVAACDFCAVGGGVKYPITPCIHPMFYCILFGFVDIFCLILRNSSGYFRNSSGYFRNSSG